MSSGSVGFIGLGIMGAPMATNLTRAGFDVVVWARNPVPVATLVSEGARSVAGIDQVFTEADTVVLMLRDEAAVDAVLDRAGGEFEKRVRDHTLIQMGTFTTAFSAALADDVRRAGGRYVEAPVSGSRGPATAGTLVAMLAGDVDGVEPIIDAMCGQTYVCGDVPSALAMKLAVNTFLITMVTGLAETFHFASRTDVDLNTLREVLTAGPMASLVSKTKASMLVSGDLEAQAAISDVLKNARLIEDAARAAGAAHPLLEASRALYEHAENAGLGRVDMVGVIAALDARAANGQS